VLGLPRPAQRVVVVETRRTSGRPAVYAVMGLAAALAPALLTFLAVSGEAEAKDASASSSEPAGLYGGAKPLRRPAELAEFLAEPPPDEDSVDLESPSSEASFRKANSLPDAFQGEPRRPTPYSDGKWLAEMSDVEKAERNAKLDALSAKWKKREEELEYYDSIRSGWGPGPERINGRFAMFFLVTGLVTEYYTGQSLPQQVYTLLQTLSIID
jgi:hypothetical protein